MKYRLALFCAVAAVAGCKAPFTKNLPPAQQLMHPGPGVDGPGPGVMMLGDPGPPAVGATSQVIFTGPEGMIITWDVSAPGAFDSEPLVTPGRYNFPQGAIYRLKLTNIPGREGVELYPSIEIAPSLPRTDAYLAHNSIPVQFTEEDFDQVLSGNFVTKVIYLPDPDFQELALAGVETLVSTRLDPGLDPIVEADRRGAILSIIRVGNKDLQVGGQQELMGGQPNGMMAGYCGPGGAPLGPGGMPMGPGGLPMGPGGAPPPYLAGVTAPEYGMPMSGTPIGLPGPPHVPLGIPAGLRRHTIKNHTHIHLPKPVQKVRMDVKQSPGMSYPKPVHRVHVHEKARTPLLNFRMPWSRHRDAVSTDQNCPDGQCMDEGMPVGGQPMYGPPPGQGMQGMAPGYEMAPE